MPTYNRFVLTTNSGRYGFAASLTEAKGQYFDVKIQFKC
jgi:hypothetical protein